MTEDLQKADEGSARALDEGDPQPIDPSVPDHERPYGAIDGTPVGTPITLEELIARANAALREVGPGAVYDTIFNLGRVVVDQAERLAKADAVIARLRARERIHLLPGGES